VISSDKTFLYVGTDGENRKIGQVRFDLEDSDARISVNLNPAFIGCGLGTRLIRAGSARIEREVPGIKEIRAEIRTDNIPSVKAFEKAGYSLSESRERNGRNWKLYKYPPR
jgi:RimJ/RimL family protein N-acetyltransferase